MRVLLRFEERYSGRSEVSVIADLWRRKVARVAAQLGDPTLPVRWRREGDKVVRVMRFPRGEYELVFRREGDSIDVEGTVISY